MFRIINIYVCLWKNKCDNRAKKNRQNYFSLFLYFLLFHSHLANFQKVWVGQLSFYWSTTSPWTRIHWRQARFQISLGSTMIRKWTLQLKLLDFRVYITGPDDGSVGIAPPGIERFFGTCGLNPTRQPGGDLNCFVFEPRATRYCPQRELYIHFCAHMNTNKKDQKRREGKEGMEQEKEKKNVFLPK